MALQQRKASIETSIETSLDNRRRRRHKLFLEVEARGPQSKSGTVIVHDISDTGLLIETKSKLKAGELIEVKLPQAGLMEAEIMWIGGEIYGCKFTRQLTSAAVSAARLNSSITPPKAENALEASIASAQNTAKDTMVMHDKLSLGARVWIIIGLALSLWILIGTTTYWALA